MEHLITIGWFIAFIIAIFFIFRTVGYIGLCNMFPEGFRWYTYPLAYLSITIFALLIIFNPSVIT